MPQATIVVGPSHLMAHLAYMRFRNYSPGTIQQRRLTLARLQRFTRKAPDRVTTEDLLAFRSRLTRAGQPLAQASQAAELSHIAAYFEWLVLEGHTDIDPTRRVPRPKLPRRLPHPMPEHDLRRAVDTADELRVRPWLLLAAFAGLRACECAPLRSDDLWWHSDPPLIIIRRAKGGDEEAVPLSPLLEPHLRLLPSRGYLFPYRDGKLGPVKPHTVSQLSNQHLHSLGIWLTFHSLRHRFGTQALRISGGDLRQVQELMRHKSIQSTVGYTAIVQERAAGIVSALPAIAM